jgi:hypothetical protein
LSPLVKKPKKATRAIAHVRTTLIEVTVLSGQSQDVRANFPTGRMGRFTEVLYGKSLAKLDRAPNFRVRPAAATVGRSGRQIVVSSAKLKRYRHFPRGFAVATRRASLSYPPREWRRVP